MAPAISHKFSSPDAHWVPTLFHMLEQPCSQQCWLTRDRTPSQHSPIQVLSSGISQAAQTGENTLLEFNVTIINQDSEFPSLPVTSQCNEMLDYSAIVPFYQILSSSFTPPWVPNQGHWPRGYQIYYYEHNSLGPLTAGEFGQCLQAHGSMPYPGSQTSAIQPEMVMVLKEIQPRNVQIPLFTSAFSYSTSAQSNSLPGEYRSRREGVGLALQGNRPLHFSSRHSTKRENENPDRLGPTLAFHTHL